jgi:hypothetical protein
MASQIRVDTAQFQKAAQALHAADVAIRKEYTKTLRDVARPFANDVLVTGASGLPRRGGLSFRVASSRPNIQVSSMRVAVAFGGPYSHELKGMDQGIIRHPVFDRRRRTAKHPRKGKLIWVNQKIRSHLFTTPFEAGASRLRPQLIAAGQRVLDQIASEAS